MKKKYEKPQVCSINYETGEIVASSEKFAERSVELKKIFENINESKRELKGGKEVFCKP